MNTIIIHWDGRGRSWSTGIKPGRILGSLCLPGVDENTAQFSYCAAGWGRSNAWKLQESPEISISELPGTKTDEECFLVRRWSRSSRVLPQSLLLGSCTAGNSWLKSSQGLEAREWWGKHRICPLEQSISWTRPPAALQGRDLQERYFKGPLIGS